MAGRCRVWRAAVASLMAAATVVSTARSSHAQPSAPAAEPPGPIAVQLEIDLPVAAAAGLLGGGMQLLREELVRDRCAPECGRAAVNALDATTLGRYSAAAAEAGNGLVALNVSLPLILGAIDVGVGGASWGDYGEDIVILSQSLAVTVALHQVVAFSAQRPRPYAYNSNLDPEFLESANGYLSFYSGHTANAFAAASTYGYLYSVRHPNSPWRGGVWALGYGLAGLQGYLRVASGYHYISDVLVGAAAGTGVGLLVPWLHTVTPGAARDPADANATTAGWTVLPWADSGAVGAQFSAWH